MYAFLKGFKGFKKVENYIVKIWTIEQQYRHPAPDAAWQPSREELEQYEIDLERIKEVLLSYKSVERILNEKEERRDEGLVSLFFCKWNSECSRMIEILLILGKTFSMLSAHGRVSSRPITLIGSIRGDQGRCARSY